MTNEKDNETLQSRHARPKGESRSRLLLRNIMNLFFMVAVLLLMVLYFVLPDARQSTPYMVFAMFTVAVKIAEMIIRFMPK